MKPTAFVLVFLPLAMASYQCATQRDSTSRKRIPTHTFTRTLHEDEVTVYTKTTQIEPTATVISIVGRTTTTIPTGPDFTPLISAPRSSSHYPYVYPTKVDCTTFVVVNPKGAKTVTYTDYKIVYPQKTLTSTVATSTAYAACAEYSTPPPYDPSSSSSSDDENEHIRGPNIIHGFRGEPIRYLDLGVNLTTTTGREAMHVKLNARTCCEWVQKNNYTGFSYDPYTYEGERHCDASLGPWYFSTFDFYPTGFDGIRGSKSGNGPGKVGGTFLNIVP